MTDAACGAQVNEDNARDHSKLLEQRTGYAPKLQVAGAGTLGAEGLKFSRALCRAEFGALAQWDTSEQKMPPGIL